VSYFARFVPAAMLPQLRTAVESTNDVEAANAALLIAAYGDRMMADRLLDLALDSTRTAHVRNSALAAYDQIGTPASAQRLLDIQDWDEPTVLSRVDAAAGLMDASNASLVLAALGSDHSTRRRARWIQRALEAAAAAVPARTVRARASA